MLEIVSLITGIVSIILGVVSILFSISAKKFAKEESEKSKQNYSKTKDLLVDIEHKTELIDRAASMIQNGLLETVNTLVRRVCEDRNVSIEPITEEEIAALFYKEDKVVMREIPNLAGGKTAIIGDERFVSESIVDEFTSDVKNHLNKISEQLNEI